MQIYRDGDNQTDFVSEQRLHINSCGIQTANVPFGVMRQQGRVDYHILLMKQGEGTVIRNGKPHILKENEFILYYPNEQQEYYFNNSPSTSYWIHFSGGDVAALLNRLQLKSGFYRLQQIGNIHKSLDRMILIYNGKSLHNELHCAGLFIDFLCQVFESVNTKSNRSVVEMLQTYIQNHYTEAIDFNQVISEQKLSLQRVTQLFKLRYGITPHKYKLELQIADAKFFLRYSDLKIAEIATQIGFEDEFYFSRIFKKHTGRSPRDFKNEHRQA